MRIFRFDVISAEQPFISIAVKEHVHGFLHVPALDDSPRAPRSIEFHPQPLPSPPDP